MKRARILLSLLLLFTLLSILMFHLSKVDSISMEPTLLTGDVVLRRNVIDVNRLKLNDVVVFRSPEDDSTLLVKRIYDIKYYKHGTVLYDVRGDNINNSCDSRNFGLVPMDKMEGVVIMVIASWDSSKCKFRNNRCFKWIN